MGASQIAAVILVAFLPLASAQTRLTVQVTDMTGAVVPGAQVDVMPVCVAPSSGETDAQGRISFSLQPGPWDVDLRVASPGFCVERRTIKLLSQSTQTIPVTLEVGGCPSKCTPICVVVLPTESDSSIKGVQVQVIDRTGEVLPNARVQVDPSLPKPGPISRTNAQGHASLDLPAGTHTISIKVPGFYTWTHQVEVPIAGARAITAVLEVAPICDPVEVTSEPLDIAHPLPDPVFLPLRPMARFEPLSPKSTKAR